MNRYLQYDLHTHTINSDGRSPIEEMANSAESNGLKGFAVTDHVFSRDGMTWREDAVKSIANAKRLNNVSILLGAEGVILNRNGDVSITNEMRGTLDLALVDLNMRMDQGIFSRTMSKAEAISAACEAMVNACSNSDFEIMAHPFNLGRLSWGIDLRELEDRALAEVALAFAKYGKIFEIMNQMYFWYPFMPYRTFEDEYLRIIGIFKRHGVRFSVGSDAHSSCGIGNFRWTARVIEKAQLQDRMYFPPQFTGGTPH